jgi:hypothetical protein
MRQINHRISYSDSIHSTVSSPHATTAKIGPVVLQMKDGRVREDTALVTAQVPTHLIQYCNCGHNFRSFGGLGRGRDHALLARILFPLWEDSDVARGGDGIVWMPVLAGGDVEKRNKPT